MSKPEISARKKYKSRILLLVGVMALVAVAVAGESILTLYRASLGAEKARLVAMAQAQAGILAAMARYNEMLIASGHPGAAREASMAQAIDAFERYEGFGESGEFVLAERKGAEILFLSSHRSSGSDADHMAPWSSELAEPMRRALSGQSGTVLAHDYAGVLVLAAYTPVAELNLGLVAKIDVAELRQPFVEAAILSAFGGALILLIGVFLFRQISAPILMREEAEAQYRLLLESTAEAIYGIDLSGNCTFVNPACVRMLGYRDQSDLLGKNMHVLIHHTRLDGTEYPETECKIFQAFREGKGAHVDDEVLWRADGRSFPAEYWSHPTIRAGKVVGSVVTFLDITARRQAEEAARRQEARLSGILDLAVEAVVSVGEDQCIQIFNGGAEIIFGYTADEAIGKPIEMLLPERSRGAHGAHMAGFEQAERPRRMGSARPEITGLRKDGSEFPAEASISLIEVGGEKLFTATLHDLTERKEAEAALLREKAQAVDYLNIAGSMIMAMDAEGHITMMNQTARRTLECADEEVVGKLWIQNFAPEDERERRYQWYLDWLADDSKEEEANTVTVVTRAGKRLLTRWHNRAIRDDAGKAIGMLCSGEDITERTKAAAALRRSEVRYHSIIDTTNEGFSRIDENLRTVEVNDALCRMLGYEREEMLGMRPSDLVIKTDHPELETRIKMSMREGMGAMTYEIQLRKRDGSTIDAQVSSNSYFDEDGNLSGGFSFVTDITHQKERDAQLRQAQKMEAVGQLTSGIAHDFNNILAVVLGNLEFAVERAEQGKDTSKQLDLAMQAAERGADLNRRLLAFSRNQITESRSVDAVGTIRGMTNILERALGEKIELVDALPDSLPQTVLDTAQLESAILNLANNARDAMPEGGIFGIGATVVSAAGQDGGSMVRIRIWDTGTGMSKEVKERAMEPFFTTKEVGQGSGLGLSMVYGFAEQFGGTIKINSELGSGTTVDMLLPITEAGDSVSSEATADQHISSANGNQTVLVVEDQKDVRDIVVTNLEILGYRVLIAKGGKEALSLIEAHDKIDLMLCDMVMPGMNGEEVAAMARAMVPGLRCLFMSGFPEKRAFGQQPSSTDIGILRKPFTRAVLAKTVQDCLAEA